MSQDNTFLAPIDETEIPGYMPEIADEQYMDKSVQFLQKALEAYEWKEENLRVIPILDTIPMVCRGDKCPYAHVCPVMRALEGKPDEKTALLDKPCRVDRQEAASIFSRMVRQLEIKPHETVDLLTVAAYVRCMIFLRRVDWEFSIYGMSQEVVSVVAQAGKDSKPYLKREANALMRDRAQFVKERSELEKQLMATRKDRFEMAKALGRHDDLQQSLTKRGIGKKLKKLSSEEEDVIEVQASDIQVEQELDVGEEVD
jgi:hypothetical protein